MEEICFLMRSFLSEIAGGTSLPATPANSRNAHAHNSRELELDEHEDTVSLCCNAVTFF